MELFDDSVVFNRKLTNLREKALKLQREELATTNDLEGVMSHRNEKCAMCEGDKDNSGNSRFHIQDLCPSDRKRIAQLVEKFAECTQMKQHIKSELAETKSENEALVNRYHLLTSNHEAEKNALKSELAETTAELNKLRLQTSYSLDLLANQVEALENELLKLTQTVRDLSREKETLENSIKGPDKYAQRALAKSVRMRAQALRETLLFSEDLPKKNPIGQPIHQSYQTDGFACPDDAQSLEKKIHQQHHTLNIFEPSNK